MQFHLRLLMAECITSISQAKIVLQLLTEVEGVQDSAKYPLQYYIEAAKDHGDIEKARKFLIKECPLCLLEYPVHEVTDCVTDSYQSFNLVSVCSHARM